MTTEQKTGRQLQAEGEAAVNADGKRPHRPIHEKASGWVMRLQRLVELRATGRKMLYTMHQAEELAAKSVACGLGPISGDAISLARHNGH